MANQDYSICIREEAGYCSVEYTADTFKVSMGLNPPTTTVSTASKVGLTTCSTVDYLYIPLGQYTIRSRRGMSCINIKDATVN